MNIYNVVLKMHSGFKSGFKIYKNIEAENKQDAIKKVTDKYKDKTLITVVRCNEVGICTYCDGTGYVNDVMKCPLCKGTGKTYNTELLKGANNE